MISSCFLYQHCSHSYPKKGRTATGKMHWEPWPILEKEAALQGMTGSFPSPFFMSRPKACVETSRRERGQSPAPPDLRRRAPKAFADPLSTRPFAQCGGILGDRAQARVPFGLRAPPRARLRLFPDCGRMGKPGRVARQFKGVSPGRPAKAGQNCAPLQRGVFMRLRTGGRAHPRPRPRQSQEPGGQKFSAKPAAMAMPIHWLNRKDLVQLGRLRSLMRGYWAAIMTAATAKPA